MKSRQFQVIETEVIESALMNTFEHAYRLGKLDALDGIHIDIKEVARNFLQDFDLRSLDSSVMASQDVTHVVD